MTKNPILNALAAAAYIGLVVSIIFFGEQLVSPAETMLLPIAFLSLFSLSAVMMACIFFYNPVLMYLEGQKAPAIKLGLQTVGAFAVITALWFGIILLSTLV